MNSGLSARSEEANSIRARRHRIRKNPQLAGAEHVEIIGLLENSELHYEGERQKVRYQLDL